MSEPNPNPAGARKSRSCLLYGCLTLLVILIAVAVGSFFLARYALNRISEFVEEYTDAVPMEMPVADLADPDYQKLEQRLATFQEGLKTGKGLEALVLTAPEINALIARHASLTAWRDRLRVQLDGDQVKGQLSLPLEQFARLPGMSRLKDRYLNGAAGLKVSLENGRLWVNLESLEVKGRALPAEVVSQLRQQNLAQDVDRYPELAETLGQLQSIEVKDSQVTIRAAGTP
jgi:hypothetical protein